MTIEKPSTTATLAHDGPTDPSAPPGDDPAPRRTPPSRIVGLDIARGLAVLGMFAAHTIMGQTLSWTDPGTWGALVNGRSSILFATLAGISIGLMTAGRPRHSLALLQARMRIVTRAGLIILIGVLLEMLGMMIAVILGVYALLFLAMLPFVAWRRRNLVILTACSVVVSAVLYFVVLPQLNLVAVSGVTGAIIGETYPAVIWFTFFLAGLTVSRFDLRALRTQATLLVTGIALAVAGPLALAALPGDSGSSSQIVDMGEAEKFTSPSQIPPDHVCSSQDEFTTCFPPGLMKGIGPDTGLSPSDLLTPLLTDDPHSGTPFEVVGSGGFAIAVIGACLLLGRVRVTRAILWPVAAVGSMALTAYALHIVVLSRVSDFGGPDVVLWAMLAAGALLACSLWKAFLGRGPAERLLALAARRATAVTDVVATIDPAADAMPPVPEATTASSPDAGSVEATSRPLP